MWLPAFGWIEKVFFKVKHGGVKIVNFYCYGSLCYDNSVVKISLFSISKSIVATVHIKIITAEIANKLNKLQKMLK